MLDLAKSFFLIIIYLFMFTCLGSLFLHLLKERFSLSLAAISGFFLYHLLFSLVALPCILTQQRLTLLMWIWLPLLCVLLICSLWSSRKSIGDGVTYLCSALSTCRHRTKGAASDVSRVPLRINLTQLFIPAIALCGVLFVLYLSICAYYVGWDTAFYVRTTLHAVENDSMYTLDALSGTVAPTLSLRYALSPFYMNSAVFCRLLNLHPLLVQNITDGSICVLLAFTVIYRIGLQIFGGNRTKAWLTVLFAAVIHVSHASLFSSSDFLLLRSYEAKAYCANVVLPFIFYCLLRLWRQPDCRINWFLLYVSVSAAVPISMSSLATVPLLVVSNSAIWLIRRDWKSVGNTALCLLPWLMFAAAYLLETVGVITLPIL